MKRGIIRGLWGIYDNSHRITRRRYRMDKDIARIKSVMHKEQPFVVYVMGEDNYRMAAKEGFDCKLVEEKPFCFDLVKYQYRNKLEILKYAMEEDGYDELIYMDWDCVPTKRLPENFWDVLHQKEKFQACLQIYHRRKAHWRKKELRKVPNGGCIYIGDKAIVREAIRLWEVHNKQDNDEIAWAKLTDNMMGGWKGTETFWKMFEIPFCNLHRGSPHPKEKLKSKDVCYIHYQG